MLCRDPKAASLLSLRIQRAMHRPQRLSQVEPLPLVEDLLQHPEDAVVIKETAVPVPVKGRSSRVLGGQGGFAQGLPPSLLRFCDVSWGGCKRSRVLSESNCEPGRSQPT